MRDRAGRYPPAVTATKIDLSALQMLVAAVEERSLAKAGEREHLVTSAASKRIAELERQIGTVLLVRHNRGVEPTPAGARAVSQGQGHLTSVRTLEGLCEEFSPDDIPKIRLAAGHLSLGHRRVPARRHPRLPGGRPQVPPGPGGGHDGAHIPAWCPTRKWTSAFITAVGAAPGVVSFPFRSDHVVLVVPRGIRWPRRRPALDQARSTTSWATSPGTPSRRCMELVGPR